MKTKTIYIADDGREFFSQEECSNYEKNAHLRYFINRIFLERSRSITKEAIDFLAEELSKEYHMVKRNREVLNQGNNNR